ncbi:MAG TPA: hypothetical protein VNO33_18495 [Kofleriaceae bacterium]|nr:hypothetical protein [Kofleriaceae bacterium]
MATLKTAAILGFLLGGCSAFGGGETFETELTWSLDPTCHQPDRVESGWIEEGFLLWTEHFGIEFTQVEAPQDDGSLYFELCPTPDLPRPGYGGWAEMNQGRGRISFYIGPSERFFIATVAHEAGHLIMHGNVDDHLPEPELGIMSSAIDCAPDRCLWSSGDVAHIEGFGLTYTP